MIIIIIIIIIIIVMICPFSNSLHLFNELLSLQIVHSANIVRTEHIILHSLCDIQHTMHIVWCA